MARYEKALSAHHWQPVLVAGGCIPDSAVGAITSWYGKRRMALPGRRCGAHPLFTARPGDAGEFRNAEGGVALQPARRGWADDGPRHTKLCGRQAPERGGLSAARRVDRPHQRQAALELGGARDLP